MLLVHKIELAPNNKQATFFVRACGVARFAWNWALAEWQRQLRRAKSRMKRRSGANSTPSRSRNIPGCWK